MPDIPSGSLERPPQELIPTEVSNVEADERAREAAPESKDVFLEEAEAAPVTPVVQKTTDDRRQTTATQTVKKDEVTVSVEKILEEGLGQMYESLPDAAKPKFRQKGEEAALEIAGMVRSLKFKVRKALELIRDWLLTIPGVNRFFLEQEAKIKVDKLNELIKRH